MKNEATTTPVEPRSLADLFEQQAKTSPESVAVEFGAERLSYRELDEESGRLAARLIAAGVGADAPVAISLERSIELLVSVLAVLKAGGACVPVDPAYPGPRREYILKDSGARWMIADPAAPESLPSRAGLQGTGGLQVIEPRAAREEPVTPAQPQAAQTPDGDMLAYIIYTSGSTGQPKGVMFPQRALLNLIAWQVKRPGFASGARALQFASLSFDVSFQEIFATWASGGTVVMIGDVDRRDPATLLQRLVEGGINRLFLPFVALRSLADAAVASGRFPAALREIYTAGEQLQVDDTLRRFFESLPQCFLENQYGPSETHVVTAHRLGGVPASWPALPPIGMPVDNVSVLLLDETQRETPSGGQGEIFIGGVCLARGYIGKPEQTAERFVDVWLPGAGATRLYRTGDLGERLPDGSIAFHGRLDQQVKLRGYRVEPGEISAVLGGHPGVAQCVVAVRANAGGVQRLVAYVVPRDRETFRARELHEFARGRLPGHMAPAHIQIVDTLPLTPSGKVDVQALPAPDFGRGVAAGEFVAPRLADELALARLWSEVLGVPEPGVRDDFFDLGGDSILAARLITNIRRNLGIDLTLGSLASAPTIESLATSMRAGPGDGRWRSLVPIRPRGSGTPIFCMHGGMAGVGSFPLLARQLVEGHPFYGLQWDGLTGGDGTRSIAAMASRYLGEIRTVQAAGPYILAGHCIGGLIGWEMVRQLRAAGQEVAHLFMLDTPNVASPRYRPARRDPGWKVILKMKKDRRALAEVWLRRAFRQPVRPEHRPVLAVRVMVRAASNFRPNAMDVPSTAIMTGLSDGNHLGIGGSWNDGAMGWTTWTDRGVTIEKVPADHNEVVHQPATAAIINGVLARLDSNGRETAAR
ncbi:MAG: amino acid adenylation domain-containing protein [Opitutaceae bacterium]